MASLQTPLDSSSVDVAVFCLSLMGFNYPSYLQEANRVLKPWWVHSLRIFEILSVSVYFFVKFWTLDQVLFLVILTINSCAWVHPDWIILSILCLSIFQYEWIIPGKFFILVACHADSWKFPREFLVASAYLWGLPVGQFYLHVSLTKMVILGMYGCYVHLQAEDYTLAVIIYLFLSTTGIWQWLAFDSWSKEQVRSK